MEFIPATTESDLIVICAVLFGYFDSNLSSPSRSAQIQAAVPMRPQVKSFSLSLLYICTKYLSAYIIVHLHRSSVGMNT
jgi:hypothetical protein